MTKNPIEKGQRLKIKKIGKLVPGIEDNAVTIIVDVIDRGEFDGVTFFKIRRGHMDHWVTESELIRKRVSQL